MIVYRKLKDNDKWHWCRNCSSWPRWNYDELTSDKTPPGKLCNEINIKMLKAILTAASYDVLTAFNGKDAIKIAMSKIPDLIILDIAMPKNQKLRTRLYTN